MRARLAGLVCAAFLCAAVDTLLTRAELTHRPLDPRLFAQALALWGVFATLALGPTLACDALLQRRGWIDGSPLRATLRQLAWTAGPVVAHSQLDPYTELGGSLSRLGEAKPWLELTAALLVFCVVLWIASRVLARVPPRWLACASVAISIGAGTLISFHERTNSSPSAAGAGERPNVLLLVWDTTRADNLELFGYERDTTPSLKKLAQEALLFTNSRSVANYTLTSHVSLLTGVYPSHHGAKMTRQRFDARATPSVTSAFKAAGYRTGAFVGTDVLHADTGVAHGFDVFDDEVDPPVCATRAWGFVHDLQSIASWKLGLGTNNGLPHWFEDFQRPAQAVLARASAWIDDGDPRPWFCMLNLYDAHWPYLPERSSCDPWVRAYDGPVDGYSYRGDQLPRGYQFSESDKRHLLELYDAELCQLDRQVDAFVSRLDLDRTALLMTSDHGEAFGEAGVFEHHDLLETQLRVPLLVRPAGGVETRSSHVPTSGVDVAPTLLALAGLPALGQHSGRSLLGELPLERTLLVEDRDHGAPEDVRVALYSGKWKLVRLGLGAEQRWELFDLSRDKLGVVDVARAHTEVLERLKVELANLRATWGADDERDARPGEGFDLRGLKALGYVDVSAQPPQ